MDRITGRFSNGTAYVKSDGCFGGSIGYFTTQKRLPEIIDKLAEFEDLMEEYGLHNVEQIKDLITANQDDRDELCYLAEENKMLKDRWQKLKELLEEDIKHNEKEFNESSLVFARYYITYGYWLLDRIKELEDDNDIDVGSIGEE